MEDQPKSRRPKRSNDARFPVARIKKLIQADEEVGKVAQATPVVVSKALELFLKDLVEEIVKDSQSRNTQKISAHTLKRVINTVPTFDFLTDLVQGVPDPITAEVGQDGVIASASAAAADKKPRRPRSDPSTGAAQGSGAPGLNEFAEEVVTKVEGGDEDDYDDEEDQEEED